MVIYMSNKKIETLDDIRAFLEGTVEVEFSIADKGECYQWGSVRDTCKYALHSIFTHMRSVGICQVHRAGSLKTQHIAGESLSIFILPD
jgi:hypothetical protein